MKIYDKGGVLMRCGHSFCRCGYNNMKGSKRFGRLYVFVCRHCGHIRVKHESEVQFVVMARVKRK